MTDDLRDNDPGTDDRSTTMDTEPSPTPDAGVAPPARRRAHPASTLFGLLFLGVAGAWAAREQQLLDGDELGRAVALTLIVLGALGLVASILLSRRHPHDHRSG